jgi:hypothetical protein
VIAVADLERVVGGCQNGDRVALPGGSVTQCRSDYALCSQRAADLARQQHPDTRASLGAIAMPFTTDDNQAKRAQATVELTKQLCGTPP